MKYQTCHIAEVAEIFSGFAFSSQDLGPEGIPVIKIANIQNKRVLQQCHDCYPENLLTRKLDRYFLQDRDCLVAMTGAGSVGKFGNMYRLNGGKFLINQRVGIIRPDIELSVPSFIAQVLSSDIYETILYGLGLGAGQPNVSAKQIGSLEIPFPPLPVQRKIAAILSAYDDLIENNLRRIKILEEMAQNLYREWFVKFRFPGHEQARFVDSPLGRIPEGWEIRKITELLKKVKRGLKIQKKDYAEKGLIPIVDQGREFLGGYTEDIESLNSGELPLIIFGDHTRILKFIDFPFACGADGTQLLKSNNERMPMALFYYTLLSKRSTTSFSVMTGRVELIS